jgi:hypothetical protein
MRGIPVVCGSPKFLQNNVENPTLLRGQGVEESLLASKGKGLNFP